MKKVIYAKKGQLKIQVQENKGFSAPKFSKKGQLKIQVQENKGFSAPKFSKKGQLKIQEMAFMLLAVVLLFIIAGMFFLSIIYKSMVNTANALGKEEAIAIAENIADMPEFSCGESLCIDSDRLLAMQNREDYRGFWPILRLEVAKISGDPEKIICTLKNYPYCNYFVVYDNNKENKSIQGAETYVALCREDQINEQIYKKCELARILVGFETKQGV